MLKGLFNFAVIEEIQAVVHQERRLSGHFLKSHLKQAQVARDLVLGRLDLGGVAVMEQGGLTEAKFHAPSVGDTDDTGKNLFMHPPKKAKARCVTEEARHVAGATSGGLLVDERNSQTEGVGGV